ncbi:MAG: hypothetical protein JXB06_08495 [Spirochaetales bacterium]|nr:hypothetical protein [Spirochaetales bacterium]
MDEATIRAGITHLLKRYLRNGLFNRLITYALVNLSAYMLLLAVMILSDSSLFLFHLLLFFSLSLLPLFLFYRMETASLQRAVRRLDEHCLVESYLHSPSEQHRAFMGERVQSYLERKTTEGAFPFRLCRGNLYLAGLCLTAFIALQLISLATFRDFSVFSARTIKNRLIERASLGEAVAELPVEDASEGGPAAAEPIRPTVGGETGQRRGEGIPEDEALQELLEDENLVAAERIERLGPGDLRDQEEQQADRGESWWRQPLPAAEADTPAQTASGIAGDEGRDSATEGRGAEAGSGEAGRTFRESPLKEYTPIPERLAAEGSEQLYPSDAVGEGGRQSFAEALFSDFGRLHDLRITFDPLFDTIRERYLELLDEQL